MCRACSKPNHGKVRNIIIPQYLIAVRVYPQILFYRVGFSEAYFHGSIFSQFESTWKNFNRASLTEHGFKLGKHATVTIASFQSNRKTRTEIKYWGKIT